MELMSGVTVSNRNVSYNMLRTRLYVCPVCGNVIHCAGEAVVSCCGITLPPLEAEEPEGEHLFSRERVEDEEYLSVRHPMTKEHFISFIAYATSDRSRRERGNPAPTPGKGHTVCLLQPAWAVQEENSVG